MSVTGCDIAWQKPTGAQLAAAGVHFASLYVGQDSTGKNMTPSVVADYAAHGVWINTNFEYGAQQMLGGAKQGAIDAALGHAQATACGMPAGRPISYSADWAATPSQITGSVIPYLVAARSVTGPGTVGVYGSYAVVTAVAAYWAAHFPGERIHLWQTVAWSKSSWYAADEVRQTGGTVTVGGIAVDLDYADAGDFGQWMPGRVPAAPTTSTEDDMTTFLISVHPDPTLPAGPANTGSGIFTTDGVSGAVHVDGPSDGPLQARFGAPVVVSPEYYQNLLANRAAVTVQVDAAALAAGIAAGVKMPTRVSVPATVLDIS